jgi:hypothetical protein
MLSAHEKRGLKGFYRLLKSPSKLLNAHRLPLDLLYIKTVVALINVPTDNNSIVAIICRLLQKETHVHLSVATSVFLCARQAQLIFVTPLNC